MEERSAGAVLFREDDIRLYLLLHYQARHWDFPKGNIEEGEEELDTVRREVKEETGIDDIIIIDGFKRVSEYYYKRAGKLVHKQVVFYLAKTNQKEVRLSYEHIGYEWLPYKEAYDRLTFKNSKRILADAEEFLNEFK
ncbi:MAG: diadenosine 5'5'''-P1,P4-tetraphosphate pyrophosphohydrolase [Candidatus Nitrosocaldaceae archaeon]|nr:MAG: diadenosine 5'5'''-P1,P4-tetraphosphate pyrophosphohydrolase [Candidatus Nitrosocaldaceae archaeon]